MDVLQTILYSAMAGICVFVMASQLVPAGDEDRRNWFLIALLGALLVHALGALLISTGGYRLAPHLAGGELPARMLLGPALYYYTLSLTSRTPLQPGYRDACLVLLGPVLIVLVMVPFASHDAAAKLALADPATRDPVLFRLAVTTSAVTTAIFLIFTAAWLVAAFRLQSRHRRLMKTRYANIERRSLDWLRIMLIVWALAWLLFAVKEGLWLGNAQSIWTERLLAMHEAIALAVFAHLAMHQPALFSEKSGAPAQVSRTPTMTQERMARTASRIEAAMANDRLYEDGDFSLRKLSDATNITENHLSETFSQYLDTNFYDFVNRYRVEEAGRLLRDSDRTVLAIAFDVGFNSRSTFNTAFRKHTGTTPSAYRSGKSGGMKDALTPENETGCERS